MGHYRSEMMSDEEFEAERREFEKKETMKREGAQALKAVFGDNAAAVAYFIASQMSTTFETRPEKYEEAIARYTKPSGSKP
jgi:hypothetical protein